MTEPLDNEALRRVVSEVRDQEPPELDWERMERRLMARIDADESQARRSRRWPLVAGLAAAAAVVLGVGVASMKSARTLENVVAPVSAGPRVHTGAMLNGTEVSVGDEVRALGQPSTVHHAGLATWTVAQAGRAIVAESGGVVTVRLVSGSIEAEVVPSARPESFAVEVEGTRVAVHGTSFRVERQSDGVRVQVREGVVGVGPVADRGRPSWTLLAGDSGNFALDGRKGDVQRTGGPFAGSRALPSRPSQKLPLAPSAAEQAKLLDQLTALTRGCFDSNTTAEKQVRVQAETTLSAVFAPDGSLRSISFDPPLSPAVTGCASGAAKGLRATPTERGVALTRSLLLGA